MSLFKRKIEPPPSLVPLPGNEELPSRRLVWECLSELFLDTEVAIQYVAMTLAESPYSIDEIEAILLYEVGPHLFQNLECVAGEWAGFDSNWLEKEILSSIKKPNWRLETYKKRKRIMNIANSDWQKTKTSFIEIRGKALTRK